MKKQIVQFLSICALLGAGLLYAFDQTGGRAAPKNTQGQETVKACCTLTKSGGLNDCNKPYYPPTGGGPTCPGTNQVKAKCDKNYDNCQRSNW
jgi:hypothetical protein